MIIYHRDEQSCVGVRLKVWHTEMFVVGVAQLVRAPGCGPGGRGFETPRPPQFSFACWSLLSFDLPQIEAR